MKVLKKMRGSIICSWPWWTDPLTLPLPMKLMKNVLQRALMDKVTRIRSPWTLTDCKGSGRGQWTRSLSFIKIWFVHFQVFSILFQNNFRYLVSQILRFWGILVSLGQVAGILVSHYPPPPGRAWKVPESCLIGVSQIQFHRAKTYQFKNNKLYTFFSRILESTVINLYPNKAYQLW